ncbi:non-ribosomal peptide synthetase [Nonomuraea aurantiaca]|uniref:non-ribosomal peptide synthetase n=1 Tax=Nonomuraea aurantiaca TaxID=2878562 RepID=UPI001CD96012|nr:non-ribosomal peptide synthetase [Nonomuraea aurantiaca]MCA2227868.1 amino acid adenylation domain-containing protein [Nonomuraea aurantiaca]
MARDGWRPPYIHEVFAQVARVGRDGVAVTDHARSLTYGELDDAAERLADTLTGAGVGPGIVVGLLMERTADAVVLVLAVLKAGGAVLAMDPAYPDAQVNRMMEAAGAAVLVTEEHRGHVDRRVLTLGGLAALSGATSRKTPEQGDLAFVNHTSGSTHHPKAVGVSHRSIAIAADGWLDSYRLRERPGRHLQYAGFGFDVFIQDLARCLLSGGELIICPSAVRLDPPALADFIQAHRVTFAEFTPSLLSLLTEYLHLSGRRLTTLETLAVGGEPWRVEAYHRLVPLVPNAVIVNTYGLAESTIDNLAHFGPPPPGAAPDQPMPLGRPHPGTEILVVADGRPVTVGVGELWLAGECVSTGYLGQPELTAQRFVSDPRGGTGTALRTGDLVRLDADGGISYLGRSDDQVKIRGVRVMLGEIESVLTAHPAVREAAVIAPSGRELVAYVTADADPPVDELCALVRHAIVPEAVPARIVRRVDLPINPNGKIDRNRLTREAHADVPTVARGGGVEDVVTRVWSQIFGRDAFAPDDHFFAIGGDSVTAVRVAMRVGSELGRHVPATALHEHPTFADFVDFSMTAETHAPAITARADPAAHPLSPGQRRLWLISKLHPGQATYVVPTLVELAGDLDHAALATALGDIVARHEPLRTIVVERDGEPMCRVLDPAPTELTRQEAADENDARILVRRFLERPFTLDAEPPFRAQLIAVGPARHWLVLSIHHIATDQDSERTLLEELGRCYDAALFHRAAPMVRPAIGYGDIALWRSTAAVEARRLEAWRRKLRGAEDHALPLEGPTPDRPGGVGESRTRWLDAATAERVRKVARGRGTTPFVTLLAAFAEIISRWCGRRDVCIGYPVSRRELAGMEDLVGFFVETSVLRLDLEDDPDYLSVVDRVRDEVADGMAALDIPFDLIAEQSEHRGPLFRVWFNHLGTDRRAPAMTGLRTALIDAPVVPAIFDLNVYVTEVGDDIRIDLVHDVAVCSREVAEEICDQYVALLGAVLERPELPVRGHRLATSRSLAVLRRPDDPLDHEPIQPSALARTLMRSVRRSPDEVAIRDQDGAHTRRSVRHAVLSVVRALRAAGVRTGEAVAVYAERDAALVAAMLGVFAAGGRLLMLDPRYPSGRLEHYLNVARPRCVIVLGRAAPAPGGFALVTRAPSGDFGVSRQAVADHEPSAFGGVGYLAFTSGTTGGPVGVLGGLGPVIHFLRWYSVEFGLGASDRFALLAGLSHDPLYRDVLVPLWTGATLCVPPPDVHATPALLLSWLSRERVTVLHLTPPLARLLIEAAARTATSLPAVRLVVLAGDTLTTADLTGLAALTPDATLVNGYGTTETPQLASRQVVGEGLPSLGSGAPGSSLLVLDRHDRLCGIGEPGRIVVRGGRLAEALLGGAPGLLPDPVPGIARFVTGDLGRYRVDGTVAYLGRADDLVKIRGFLVNPIEVDEVLARDRAVAASVTVVRPGADGNELVSYVVPSAAHRPAIASLRSRLAAVLPSPSVPVEIIEVARLSVTANGKIDLSSLPDRAQPTASAHREPPESPLERHLAEIWSSVLGVTDLGVTDNFFDLGGTSLKMIRLHTAVCRELGAAISLITLYENPTIQALARGLAQEREDPIGSERRLRGRSTSERSRRIAARRRV